VSLGFLPAMWPPLDTSLTLHSDTPTLDRSPLLDSSMLDGRNGLSLRTLSVVALGR